MANTKSIDLELSSSQYLSITDANQTGLDITGDISFSAWIKLEQLPSTAGADFHIISKNNIGVSKGYRFLIDSGSDALEIRYSDADLGNNTTITCDTGFTSGDVGTWIHVAVAVDVSVPSATFYIDNSSKSSTASATDATSINNSSSNFAIGADFSSGSSRLYFDGKMDLVGIWDTLLTSSNVNELYNSGNGIQYANMSAGLKTNLQGYWDFEDNLLDDTSNNNDLTNNNSAVYSADVPSGTTAYSITCEAGSFTLTGNDATMTRAFNLIAEIGSFILTGKDIIFTITATKWIEETKHTSSWDNNTKHTSNWTNEIKN